MCYHRISQRQQQKSGESKQPTWPSRLCVAGTSIGTSAASRFRRLNFSLSKERRKRDGRRFLKISKDRDLCENHNMHLITEYFSCCFVQEAKLLKNVIHEVGRKNKNRSDLETAEYYTKKLKKRHGRSGRPARSGRARGAGPRGAAARAGRASRRGARTS